METIVKVDELIKADMLKMVQVITDTGYVKMNPTATHMMRIEGDVATIFNTVENVDIVEFKVTKKKKYSVVWNSVVAKFKLDRKEVAKKVASDMMEYIKGYGEIKEIKLDLTDIGFEVEGRNEDKYMELSEVYYKVDTMGMKKQEVLMAMKEHLEIIKINEMTDEVRESVKVGDAVIVETTSIKGYKNTQCVVHKILDSGVEVKYRDVDGDLCFMVVNRKEIKQVARAEVKNKEVEVEEEIIIEKMEEKEMTTTKAQLRNRLTKLGKVCIGTTDRQEIENAVYDLFPNAMEVGLDENMEIDFLVGEEYTGAKPAKKVMKEIDEDFDYIVDMGGLSVYVERYTLDESNKIRITADLHIKFRDKFGCVHEDGVDVVEIMIDIPQDENAVEEKMTMIYSNCNTAIDAKYGAKKLEKYLENNTFNNDALERTVVLNIKQLNQMEKTFSENEKRQAEENRATRYIKVANEVLSGEREDVDKVELVNRLSRLDFDMLNVDTIAMVATTMKKLELEKDAPTEEETVNMDEVVFVVKGTDSTLEVFDDMDMSIKFAYEKAKKYSDNMQDVEIIHDNLTIKLVEHYRGRTSTVGEWSINVKNINKKEDTNVEPVKETILDALAQVENIEKYYDKDSDTVCVDTGAYTMTKIGKQITDAIGDRKDIQVKLHNEGWVTIPHYSIRMKNNKKYIGEGVFDTGKRSVTITELGAEKCTKRD